MDGDTELELRLHQDRKDAPAAVAALLLAAVTERAALLATDPRFASPGVAEVLLAASGESAGGDAPNACALARLALAVTQRVDRRLVNEEVVAALAAEGWARLARALAHCRALAPAGGFAAADEALCAAARAAAFSPLDSLEHATVCREAATSRDDEGHATDALSSLLRNPRLFRAQEEPRHLGAAPAGDTRLPASPDAQEALSTLRQALALVDPAADPWAALRLRQALALAHADLGQAAAAREVHRGCRELLPVAFRERLDPLRHAWTEAKILERLGEDRQALRRYLFVAGGFARSARPCEAVSALLDHAELLVRLPRRPGELASLRALGARFTKLLPRTSFGVLTVTLRLAGRREVVFADLLDHVRDYLRVARREPDRPYTPSRRPRSAVAWDRLTVAARRRVCRQAGVAKRLASCAAGELDAQLRDVIAWSCRELTAVDILWCPERAAS
jgi:hypothetical protein